MKKFLLIAFVLGFAVQSWGQSLINENRRLTHPVELEEVGAPGLSKSVEKGSNFSVVGENDQGDKYKIYFWDWDKETDESKYNTFNYDMENKKQRYFLIDKNMIELHSVKIYSRIDPIYGVLTFPFKWRLDTGEIEPTFSLNIAGGAKWRPFRTERHVVSFLLGIGPSTVNLDHYNSNIEEGFDDLTTAAITLSGNLMYQFDTVQFGFSFGIDKIFDNKLYNWDSQGNPWFALGVGLNIFTNDPSSEPKSKNNHP